MQNDATSRALFRKILCKLGSPKHSLIFKAFRTVMAALTTLSEKIPALSAKWSHGSQLNIVQAQLSNGCSIPFIDCLDIFEIKST